MGVAMQRALLLHDVPSLADKFASLSGNMLPGVFLFNHAFNFIYW